MIKTIIMIKRFSPYFFWIYIIVLLIVMVIPNMHIDQKAGFRIFYFRLDYWLHFFSYFGLCFLFLTWKYSEVSNFRTNSPFRYSWWIFILAAFTEILQKIVPGRSTSLKDFIANSIGISLGLISFYIAKSIVVWFLDKRGSFYRANFEPSVLKIKNQTKV
jgi:hypothetical protein